MSNNDSIRCIICNNPIKRGEKGTCIHGTGLDHHLACPLPTETEEAILQAISDAKKEARIDEIQRYDHMSYHSREEHEEYIQKRIATLKEQSTNNKGQGEETI